MSVPPFFISAGKPALWKVPLVWVFIWYDQREICSKV